jgi:hypothetical protein
MTVLSFRLRTSALSNHGDDISQRLLAANEVWFDLLSMQLARHKQNSPLSNRNMVFFLFSRFVHELVQDHDLRGQLLDHFEKQLKGQETVVAALTVGEGQ